MEEGRSVQKSSAASLAPSSSQKVARVRNRGGAVAAGANKKFFRCSVCSYVTNVKARYTKHVKYHSMPLIKCDFCDFKSPYKWNLDRHLKNHNGEGDLHCPLCNFTADIKQSLTVHVQNHHASITEQQLNFKIKQQQQQQMMMGNDEEGLDYGEEQMQDDDDDIEDEDVDGDINDGQQLQQSHELLGSIGMDKYNHHQVQRKKSHENAPDESFYQKSVFLQSLALKPNVVYSVTNDNDEEEEEEDDDDDEEEEYDEEAEGSGSRGNKNILPPLLATTNTTTTTSARLTTPKSSPPGRRISIASNEESSITKKLLLGNNNVVKKSREKSLFLEELTQKLVASKSEEHSSSTSLKNSNLTISSTTNSTRCQFCRQRCKTSADLASHLTICSEANHASDEENSNYEARLSRISHSKINNNDNANEDGDESEEDEVDGQVQDKQPMDCTSENKIFVWNKFPIVDDDDDEEIDDDGNNSNEMSNEQNYTDDLIGFETAPGIGAIHVGKLEEVEYEGLDPGKLELLQGSVTTTRKVYRCPQVNCGFWATTASRFHVHSVGHCNLKPFECSQCSYKSNWKWDITKHIKLKVARDPLHANAKVLLTHESGQRNYRKYDKFLVMMQLKHSADSKLPDCSTLASKRTDIELELSPPTSLVSSPKVSPQPIGGNTISSTNLPTNLTMPKLTRAPVSTAQAASRAPSPSNSVKSEEGKVRPPPALVPIAGGGTHNASSPPLSATAGNGGRTIVEKRMLSGGHILLSGSNNNPEMGLPDTTTELYGEECDVGGPPNKKARITGENLKKILWKCKKCPFKHTSKEIVIFHIRQYHKPKRGESVSILSPNFLSSVSQQNDDEAQDDGSVHKSVTLPSVKETHQYVFNDEDGIFKCKFCPFTVDKLQVMESHSENHFSKPNSHFSCDHCSFSVQTKRELMEHTVLHGWNAATINNDYNDRAADDNNLTITAEETPPKPRGTVNGSSTHKKYHCIECPYVTDSKGQFLYHKQFHRPRDCPFKCSQCSYMVSHKHLLHQHLRVHGLPALEDQGSGVEVNEDGSVVDEQPLDLHQDMAVEAIHPTVLVWRNGRPFRMYRCRMCPRVYTKINDLNEHEMAHGGSITITPSNQNSSDAFNYSDYNNFYGRVGGEGNENENISNPPDQQHPIISPNNSDNSTSAKSLHCCDACPARFFYEKELDIHSSFHQSKSDFQCHLCSYSAKQQNPHLLSHMKVHGLDYQMKTQQLLMRYPKAPKRQKKPTTKNSTNTLNIPQVSHFLSNSQSSSIESAADGNGKKPIIVCQKCPAKFHSKNSYQQHITFHGRDSVFQCRHCDYSVDTLKNLTLHELLHAGSTSATSDAMYAASSNTATNKAIKFNSATTVHSSPVFDNDRIDNSAYVGNPEFIYPTYVKNGRVKEKRYKCSKCPSAFEKRDQYKVHMGLHGSDQRYKCAVCDYAVTYYANFIQHLKKHSTQPDIPPELLVAKPLSKASKVKNAPVAASGGVKKTTGSASPVANINTPTSTANSTAVINKKQWKCPNCPFTSTDRDEAQDHKLQHSQAATKKPTSSRFKCSYCDFATSKSSLLKEHTRLHFHVPSEQVESYMYAKDVNVFVDGNYEEKLYSEKEMLLSPSSSPPSAVYENEENHRVITYIDMKSRLPVPMLQNDDESGGEEYDEDEHCDDEPSQPIDFMT